MVDLPGSPLRDLPAERRDLLGTPLAEITTILDVTAHRVAKLRALAAHRTQTGDGGPLSTMSDEQRDAVLAREHFVRASLPWSDGAAPGADPIGRIAAANPTGSA
jgi:LmbE family N-acetylglucosaminyl deacetylase